MTNTVANLGIIGLDTSHTIEFTRHLQGVPEADRLPGMHVVKAMRFPSAFQSEPDQDKRQAQLEEWGVRVSTSLADTIAGVDAILLCINDPDQHRRWFAEVAGLGLPVFLDKPLAGSLADGKAILDLARARGTRVWSASSLRFADGLIDACTQVPQAELCNVYGPLGLAPAGSSVVWYGVHAFEMLSRIMGPGVRSVFARRDARGVVAIVQYDGGRRGVVEITENSGAYGGRVHGGGKAVAFNAWGGYRNILVRIREFITAGTVPVGLDETYAILAMLIATEGSIASGREEPVTLERAAVA